MATRRSLLPACLVHSSYGCAVVSFFLGDLRDLRHKVQRPPPCPPLHTSLYPPATVPLYLCIRFWLRRYIRRRACPPVVLCAPPLSGAPVRVSVPASSPLPASAPMCLRAGLCTCLSNAPLPVALRMRYIHVIQAALYIGRALYRLRYI